MVPRHDPLSVQVRIVGQLEGLGVDVLAAALEVDYRHGAVAQVEVGAEHGIGDV